MISDNPKKFLDAFRKLDSSRQPTTMKAAMLVSPLGFRVNEQSASDNLYMNASETVGAELAFFQHQNVVGKLRALGLKVKVFPGQIGLDDGVFPNNAFGSTPGHFIVGKMHHAVRQQETARSDIREFFLKDLGYSLIDLSVSSSVAELTGSLIVDHARAAGFCGLSLRADRSGCEAMHKAFGLMQTFCFELVPSEYHTNVVLSVLAGRGCVIYPDAFVSSEVADTICACYGSDAVVVIDKSEKDNFAGNCLAVTPKDILMSARANESLSKNTRAKIERLGFKIHGIDISELEKGGGSLRCLIAEIF